MKNSFFRNFFYDYLIKTYLFRGRIADIGCGEGIFSRRLGDRGVGIDISLNILKDRAGDNLVKVCAEAELLPFKDSSFYGGFCADVLEHTYEPFSIMQEINRVMKKSAFVILLTPFPSNDFWDEPTHVKPYTPVAFKRLFVRSGFEPVRAFRLWKTVIGIGKKIKDIDSENVFWSVDKKLKVMQY